MPHSSLGEFGREKNVDDAVLNPGLSQITLKLDECQFLPAF